MTILIITALIILIIWKLLKPYIILKKMNLSSFNLITGSVKTGKSTLAIYLSVYQFYARRNITKLENFFRKIFKKEQKELPVLYSNIPIATKYGYSPLTKEILLREKVPIEKSIIYIGEFSLVADSMNFSDMIINPKIMAFFKLFGHEFAGTIIVDTQNVADCHFAIKKITNKYIFIEKGNKFIPFYYKMWIRELAYNYENNSINNTFNKKTIEEDTQAIYIPKSIWKVFDYRCYSILTDGLEIERNNIPLKEIKTLKQDKIVSFNKWVEKILTRKGGK